MKTKLKIGLTTIILLVLVIAISTEKTNANLSSNLAAFDVPFDKIPILCYNGHQISEDPNDVTQYCGDAGQSCPIILFYRIPLGRWHCEDN